MGEHGACASSRGPLERAKPDTLGARQQSLSSHGAGGRKCEVSRVSVGPCSSEACRESFWASSQRLLLCQKSDLPDAQRSSSNLCLRLHMAPQCLASYEDTGHMGLGAFTPG